MVKLIKPLFYEDIDELIGGLLKKKRKKKSTFTASQYSTLKKITPQPAKNPKFRDISPYDPPAPRHVPVYFPPIPAGLKARARKPDAGKRRTHAEQLADLGRDTELKTLRGLTKFQQGIRRLLEGKPTAERKKIIEEETRRLKEAPTTEKITSVSSKSRRKQIDQARKEGKLKPLPLLLPRAPEEEKYGEYEAPAMAFPPVPPKLPGELALLEPVKKPRGRPPKSPAQKAEAAALKAEIETAAAKREEKLKKSKSGSLDVIFGKLAPKVSPKAQKASPKAETPAETAFRELGSGKFKKLKQKKRKY